MDLACDAPFVALHGPNAQGKTNALEAIYFLSTLKPLRAKRSRELICWGADHAAVAGEIHHEGLVRKHRVEIGTGRRSAEVDGKTAPMSDYFATIRAIAFTPADLTVVGGEPARRRAWIDRAAFTASPVHLDVVRTWRRALDQKAAELRSSRPDPGVLDVLDESIAVEGARLVTRRRRLIEELRPHIEDMHAHIARQVGALGLRYRTFTEAEKLPEVTDALRKLLGEARSREVQRRQPLVGPQGDDVEITLGGQGARAFGSQGQIRTTVLSLKLAELLAARARGDVPLFLIDDVGSELDRERKRQLVSVLSELRAQVFATTTDPDHLDALPWADTLWCEVKDGVIRSQTG